MVSPTDRTEHDPPSRSVSAAAPHTHSSWPEFFSPSGRARTIWPGAGKFVILAVTTVVLVEVAEEIAQALNAIPRGNGGDFDESLTMLLLALFFWPTVARRLHDQGRSGALALPSVALLVSGSGSYDAVTLWSTTDALRFAAGATGLLSLAWLLTRPGEVGPNRFGPDPYA